MTAVPSFPTLHQSNHLPPFIGRQIDLQKLLDLFRNPSVRLVTLLGEGGIGKTRLALELAGGLQDWFRDGVIFLPLAQLSTIEELLPALAGTLGVHLPAGGELQQAVMDHLGSRQMLLVLDNFEHLLEEAILIHAILAASPQVRVLVTSREKLNLETENLYRLKGLDLSSSGKLQELEQCGAIRLFLQKARQVRPDFALDARNAPALIRICQLVDGNPLGILMAAAWVEHFSPAEIVEQTNENLDFLALNLRDTEIRHSNMRAVFASSFARLDDHTKAILRKLAVFRGGFDLAAGQAVAGADLQTLIGLIDKSLLARNPDARRYELHELLRQYAWEEMTAAGESESAQAAHRDYFAAFVQRREAQIISSSQTKALAEIQADFDNIRQAWSGVIEKRDFASARGMLPALYDFCDTRSQLYDGEALFRQAVEGLKPQAGEVPDTAWALALLSWYDMRAYFEHFESYDQITSQAQACLDHSRITDDPQEMAASLTLLGAIAGHQGDFTTAIRNYKEAMQVHPTLDDAYWVNIRIGLAHQDIHNYNEAIEAFQTSLQRGRELGERVKIGWSLFNIGDTLLLQGKPTEAEDYIENALLFFKEIGNEQGVLRTNYSLGRVAIDLGNLPRARELAEIASRIAREIHAVFWIQKTDQLLQRIDPEFLASSGGTGSLENETLSPRELEILQLLKSELSGPEIASRLVVSLNTVRYHTKNIYQKLGVNNRLEAIRRAKELVL
jgi:predicted ATPase/DNA-binding CsgD family transcriptional regulator